MLYTMILDYNKYLVLAWDKKQITSLVGDMRSSMEKRIDMWNAPVSFKGVFNEPLKVTFPKNSKEDLACKIPDIAAFQGRLFLNPKAYEVLKPLIENDGEFLPAIYEQGAGHIFIPLRVAEDVDGLDTDLSKKDEWGQIENLAFHENKVKDWNVFRTAYNDYDTLQCQQAVKDAIESADLKGLYFTPNLGNIFPEEPGAVSKLN